MAHEKLQNIEEAPDFYSSSNESEEAFHMVEDREYLRRPPPNIKKKNLNDTSFAGTNLWQSENERVKQKNEVLTKFQQIILSAEGRRK